MPRGSAPIIPRGSAFRICLWQIRKAPAVALEREYVVGFFGGYMVVIMAWAIFLTRDDGKRCGDNFVFGYILLEDLAGKSSSIGFAVTLYA